MRTLLLTAILMLAAAADLRATEALIFDGGGYTVYLLVGNADKPAIAQVHLTMPEGKDRVLVPRERVQVKTFDEKRQILLLNFANKEKQPDLPPSFSLSVKKKNGVLTIGRKQIKGAFDWLEG